MLSASRCLAPGEWKFEVFVPLVQSEFMYRFSELEVVAPLKITGRGGEWCTRTETGLQDPARVCSLKAHNELSFHPGVTAPALFFCSSFPRGEWKPGGWVMGPA